MDFGIVAGDTDQTIYVRLRDSTTGLAKTGLAFNSAGAVCSYVLPGAARAAITLATQTVAGAHSDGGFVEVDATNCKGLYRLDLPDAAIASGKYSLISIEFDGIIEETVIVPLSLRKSDLRQVSGSATPVTNLNTVFNTDFAANYNTTADGWVVKLGDYAHGGASAAVTLASLTNNGATTLTGNVSLGGTLTVTGAVACNAGVTFTSSTGSGFVCSSSGGNGDGARFLGNGSGDGYHAEGGATGHGAHMLGGSTSGDGLRTTIVSGAGITANITGNITGNISGSIGSLGVQAKADVNAEADTALTDYDPPTNAEMEARTLVAASYGTASNQTTIIGYIDTEVAAILAAVDTELAALITTVGAAGAGLTALAQASVATEARLAELDAANLPADVDQLKADNPNRPARGVELANLMFMMVDATDLNTPETGITVTATISKDGGAFAACTNAVSEVSGGWYKITLTSTEMTADSVAVKFTGTGCAQRNIAFRTQPT